MDNRSALFITTSLYSSSYLSDGGQKMHIIWIFKQYKTKLYVYHWKQNDELWNEVLSIIVSLYDSEILSRPTKVTPVQKELFQHLKDYALASNFVAEVPSLTGIKCSCSPLKEIVETEIFGVHDNLEKKHMLPRVTVSFFWSVVLT